MVRIDKRKNDEIRDTKVEGYPNYIIYPEGSVLISQGKTKVLCNVSVRNDVPRFIEGSGRGWLTAEYNLLPFSTHSRNIRESRLGHVHGRTQEISRLIGRALRGIFNLDKIGERSIIIDCDVIQADGGTRCASITGSYIALYAAVQNLLDEGRIYENPILEPIAAISAGIVNLNGTPEYLLDLCYEEDSNASVDLNCVMTESRRLIEVQATAERKPFDQDGLNKLVDLSWKGIEELIELQKSIIKRD
ncbi:MAG: ribonuclease PH [Promethearchaeota archaeon]|nr:MAG: ribonuclease PH [Candidatus Lokiarchaeota archaeon]